MKIVFILLVLFPIRLHAQKIAYDKTDPFTNIRTITTDPASLQTVAFTPIVQVVSTVEVQDNLISAYKLAFVIQDVGISSIDTITTFYCMLKTDDGKIIKGEYVNSVKAAVAGKYVQMHTYVFSTDDINTFKNSRCTNLKFIAPAGQQALIEIDNKAEDRISDQCKKLLTKISKS